MLVIGVILSVTRTVTGCRNARKMFLVLSAYGIRAEGNHSPEIVTGCRNWTRHISD